ncbi:uncharacterized protein RJT20DRAFT_78579, partial [Scheffersomyces xylosifermentans]|uniref:uncharacterized protein n=1 Tax=Scheffersomyces xylosifermentans TaxID=1304137 RepID=UPI00315CD34F
SCATSGYLPIYTLTIDDKSFAAKQILSSLQEGLKMISYVAKDLSVTLNNNDLRDSKIDYMDVIDTFSNHNEYKFSFGGYCRMNSVTGVESCSDCNGIDIFSCLIKDIGLQLGSISKVEDPKVIGTSFVITYSSSLSSLETLYRRGKLNEPGFEELDIDRLSLVHGLKMAHYFDKYMRYFLLWNTVLGILVSSSIIYVFLQVLLLRKSPTLTQLRSLPFNMTFLLVLSTASLVFHIFFVAALDFYYMSLEQVLHKYEIAAISRGSGHALFVVSTLF